jgi:hypothetical protein
MSASDYLPVTSIVKSNETNVPPIIIDDNLRDNNMAGSVDDVAVWVVRSNDHVRAVLGADSPALRNCFDNRVRAPSPRNQWYHYYNGYAASPVMAGLAQGAAARCPNSVVVSLDGSVC